MVENVLGNIASNNYIFFLPSYVAKIGPLLNTATGRAYIVYLERSTVHEGSIVDSSHSSFQLCAQILFLTVHSHHLAPPAINSTTHWARLQSHVIVCVWDVGVRKTSLAEQGSRVVVLALSSSGGGSYSQCNGCGGRRSGGRAGGKIK